MHAWSKRIGAALLIVALAAGAACGDGDREDSNGDSTPVGGASTAATFPVTVDRSDGRQLVVNEPVRRIVSLSPGATEIIYAIGAEASLAAVDNNANYPQAAADFAPKVDAYEPNIEAIADLEPDLVIVASNTGGLVEALDRLEIPVLYLDLDTDVREISDVLRHIEILGRLTDRDALAQELTSSLEQRVEAVEAEMASIENADAPTVYHELDATLYSVSNDTFIGHLYTVLKANNIAGDGGGIAYPQLSQEAIIEANPQVIVLADEAFGVTVESVKARPGWDAIDAVQNDRIYPIDPDIISRPGPRIVDALEELARLLHPQAFS